MKTGAWCPRAILCPPPRKGQAHDLAEYVPKCSLQEPKGPEGAGLSCGFFLRKGEVFAYVVRIQTLKTLGQILKGEVFAYDGAFKT